MEKIPTNTNKNEGYNNKLLGNNTHAEGENNIALGKNSHVEGEGNIALGENQHVSGTYNLEDEDALVIVGNGTKDSKSNAYKLDKQGNAIFSGIITINNNEQLATLNYVNELIINIQNELNNKQMKITGGASTITSSNLPASRALVSNTSGKVAVSAVTSTELGYLDGVTGNVQTQLDGKSDDGHTHTKADITDFPTSLPANGGNASTVNGHTVQSNVPQNAKFTDTVYDDSEIKTAISGKQATITGGASTITSSNLTANRALISNASGKVGASVVTSTELAYLRGLTGNVQTQLNNKAPKSHASTANTYGIGTSAYYGHVKLSDSVSTTSGASLGMAATPTAVRTAYDKANSIDMLSQYIIDVLNTKPTDLDTSMTISEFRSKYDAASVICTSYDYDGKPAYHLYNDSDSSPGNTIELSDGTIINLTGDYNYISNAGGNSPYFLLTVSKNGNIYTGTVLSVQAVPFMGEYNKLNNKLDKDFLSNGFVGINEVTQGIFDTRKLYESSTVIIGCLENGYYYYTNGYNFITCTTFQSAFGNAINLLPGTGGKILLREGTYSLDNGINLNKNIIIEGMGQGTIINFSNGYNFKIYSYEQIYINIKNIMFNIDKNSFSNGLFVYFNYNNDDDFIRCLNLNNVVINVTISKSNETDSIRIINSNGFVNDLQYSIIKMNNVNINLTGTNSNLFNCCGIFGNCVLQIDNSNIYINLLSNASVNNNIGLTYHCKSYINNCIIDMNYGSLGMSTSDDLNISNSRIRCGVFSDVNHYGILSNNFIYCYGKLHAINSGRSIGFDILSNNIILWQSSNKTICKTGCIINGNQFYSKSAILTLGSYNTFVNNISNYSQNLYSNTSTTNMTIANNMKGCSNITNKSF